MATRERSGLVEFLFGELRSAMADARTKLIDEGWFGRRAAPQREASPGWTSPDAPSAGQRSPSFEEQWATRAPADPTQAEQDRGIGLDR